MDLLVIINRKNKKQTHNPYQNHTHTNTHTEIHPLTEQIYLCLCLVTFSLTHKKGVCLGFGFGFGPEKKVLLVRVYRPCFHRLKLKIKAGTSSSSPGPSSNCVNCKLLAAKIKVLEAQLMMARGHEDSSQSAAAIQEVIKRKISDKEIKERVAKLNQMPKKWKDSAKRFKKLKNKKTIRIVSPPDMYVKQRSEDVEYQDILDLHTNAHLSVAIIHWWSMCLYQKAESCGGNKCVFLNPNVTIMYTKFVDLVVYHICETKKTHPEKENIYSTILSKRRSLAFILALPSPEKGIYNSSRYQENSKKDYHLTPILGSAFETRFEWMMMRCYQQKEEWESGYYLLHHMYELVISKQINFPQNLWNDARHLGIYDIAYVTSSKSYKSVVTG